MWHKTAVQLEATELYPGGWHYAQLWKSGGGPIGYCRDHPPHETEAEARWCYTTYQRDNIVLDGAKYGWTSCEAKDCPNPTQSGATIRHDGYATTALCPEHMNYPDAVTALGLEGPAGDSWGS
jgi:hypothetical protein